MINEHVYLISQELVLVPYLAPFVPRYHEWMCDTAILAATESEPLSLEEERENQQSWLHATDKMTFILLAPLGVHGNNVSANEYHRLCRGVEEQQERNDSTAVRLVSLEGVVPPLSEVLPPASSSPPAAPRASFGRAAPGVSYPGSIVTAEDHFCTVDEFYSAQGARSVYPLLKRYCPSQTKELFKNMASSPASLTRAVCPSAEDAQRHALDQLYVMIGDCNLFLLEEEEEDDDEDGGGMDAEDGLGFDWLNPSGQQQPRQRQRSTGIGAMPSGGGAPLTSTSSSLPSRTFEVEVMVADASFRRRGLAETAVRMIMQYAVAVCGATRFVAKILDTNVSSIALFTERLRFSPFKEVKVFHEVHFARSLRTDKERCEWELECRRSGRGRPAPCDASFQARASECESHVDTVLGGSEGVAQPRGSPSMPTQHLQSAKLEMGNTYWCAPLDDLVASSMRVFTQAP
ncbi:hypothetical protein JKF63_04387 [Porcisia hertigi]|uniref:N-acetyltransferase domain-containing protein n=1 Tax=Porcisia hertigi TaxID=2761500 RepID=A0A836ISC6_9TRYP|nr:hypothetical protein JKF63_04387 [Porcisia hertigi]